MRLPSLFDLGSSSVLVIEDDAKTCAILQLYLEGAGFDVLTASDGRTGLRLAQGRAPCLIVLDLMLPGIDGWSICRSIRESSDVPILILSARQEEDDRLLGLGLGADDYVVKPFSPREVVMRVQTILRRVQPSAQLRRVALAGETDSLGRGPLRLYENERRVTSYGHEVSLTPQLELWPAPGHTPHMQIVLVVTGEGTLAFLADLVPTSSHVSYPYIMGFDLEPLVTLATKKRILPRAAAEGWWLVFEHDSRMPLGRLVESGGRLEAQAIRPEA